MAKAAVTVKKNVDELIQKLRERVGQGEIITIRNTYGSAVTLPHPTGNYDQCLTWMGDEDKTLDIEADEVLKWLRSRPLRKCFENGTFVHIEEDEIREKVTLPPELVVYDEHYKHSVDQILGNNESLAYDLINMASAPQTRGRPIWLKDTWAPVLRAALYIEERDRKRRPLIDAMKKQIKIIEQMPLRAAT